MFPYVLSMAYNLALFSSVNNKFLSSHFPADGMELNNGKLTQCTLANLTKDN